MQQKRVGLVAFISLTFLTAMTMIRVILGVLTPSGSGLTMPLVLKAAATGLAFDLSTLAYALLPVALYLLLVPRRLLPRRA